MTIRLRLKWVKWTAKEDGTDYRAADDGRVEKKVGGRWERMPDVWFCWPCDIFAKTDGRCWGCGSYW